MFYLIKKYHSINKTERKILNRAFIWLIYAFVLVRIIPLRWFSDLLGEYNKIDENEIKPDQLKFVNMLTKSVRRWKRYLPWKVKCFEEALAAKKVLEKCGIETTLYLGVAKKDKDKLKAHAWLKSGGKFIVGEKAYKQFAIVGFYS